MPHAQSSISTFQELEVLILVEAGATEPQPPWCAFGRVTDLSHLPLFIERCLMQEKPPLRRQRRGPRGWIGPQCVLTYSGVLLPRESLRNEQSEM
jgi:hypothetical protein